MDNDEGGFISGIFNYCDRWCERCPLTARCRAYAIEHSGPPPRDVPDDEFWEHLHGIFAQTLELVKQAAQEMGIALDELDDEDCGRSAWDDLEHDDILQVARRYGTDVQAWLDAGLSDVEFDEPENEDEPEPLSASDALEIIAWYQFQIFTKLTRATAGLVDVAERDSYAQPDCDGSAKVALIGIDRSLMAWHHLMQRTGAPGTRERLASLMVDLGRLRGAVERRFPMARSFVRPGFDSPAPEQMS